jgi:signal peptidase I
MSETPVTAPKKDAKKEMMEWVKSILVALVIVAIVRAFLFTMIRVEGESMLAPLRDGDRLAAPIIAGKLFGDGRGDIVICTYPGADHLLREADCRPAGETIELRSGVVFNDGEELDEPYLTPEAAIPWMRTKFPRGHTL